MYCSGVIWYSKVRYGMVWYPRAGIGKRLDQHGVNRMLVWHSLMSKMLMDGKEIL